jgi:hypothetical protein
MLVTGSDVGTTYNLVQTIEFHFRSIMALYMSITVALKLNICELRS